MSYIGETSRFDTTCSTSADYWYNKWKKSSLSNACVLRITNQCNAKCSHCAFRSGPECIGQMSVKTCKKINAWVPKRIVLNIMGGEFSILDNYPEMLVALARGRNHIHLVSNGFWSHSPFDSNRFLLTLEELINTCQTVDIAISDDDWHELSSHRATELLEDNKSEINIVYPGNLGRNNITPVGRAWDNKIVPRKDTKRSCEIMSNMIITEDGMIGRCPFGYFPWKHFSETTWHDAQEYIWGWRSEKLAEGMHCHLCMETIDAANRSKIKCNG